MSNRWLLSLSFWGIFFRNKWDEIKPVATVMLQVALIFLVLAVAIFLFFFFSSILFNYIHIHHLKHLFISILKYTSYTGLLVVATYIIYQFTNWIHANIRQAKIEWLIKQRYVPYEPYKK